MSEIPYLHLLTFGFVLPTYTAQLEVLVVPHIPSLIRNIAVENGLGKYDLARPAPLYPALSLPSRSPNPPLFRQIIQGFFLKRPFAPQDLPAPKILLDSLNAKIVMDFASYALAAMR